MFDNYCDCLIYSLKSFSFSNCLSKLLQRWFPPLKINGKLLSFWKWHFSYLFMGCFLLPNDQRHFDLLTSCHSPLNVIYCHHCLRIFDSAVLSYLLYSRSSLSLSFPAFLPWMLSLTWHLLHLLVRWRTIWKLASQFLLSILLKWRYSLAILLASLF